MNTMPEWYQTGEVQQANKWWFAPAATVSVTQQFYPARKSGRAWFFFGGCLFWMLLFWLMIALVVLQAAMWLTVVLIIWIAQLVVALFYGLPVLAIRKFRK